MESIKKFKDFKIKPSDVFSGEKIKMSKILNKDITVINYRICDSKYESSNSDKCLHLQIEIDGEKRVVFTGSKVLRKQISNIPVEELPFITTIVKESEHFEFT